MLNQPGQQEMMALAAAEVEYRNALKIRSELFEVHWHLGVTLVDLGRSAEAVASYRCALCCKPDFVEAHCNLGAALMELGHPDEAEACFRRALEIMPDLSEAHCNLGVIHMEMGRLADAEASYHRALAIKPDYAEAHNNLGATFMSLGSLDKGEVSYHRALQIWPLYADALNNLALLLNACDKKILALNTISQSLKIRETESAKRIFVECVKRLRCTRDNDDIRALLICALSTPWGRPSEMARICTDIIRLNPVIGECMSRSVNAWPRRLPAHELFAENGLGALAGDLLLGNLLKLTPICDIVMERFLTMARYAMLDSVTVTPDLVVEIGTALSFFSALAGNCFINEYVFSYTDDEIKKAAALRDKLSEALESRTDVPVIWPVVVASYFPLCSVLHAERLLDSQWPADALALLLQQIREPQEEQQLRATIPRLTDIEDEVSLLVQNQYEENPYPRWVKASPVGKTENVWVALKRRFPLAAVNRSSNCGRLDILIAGCGTGQHPIETARKFKGAQVLAVDLSISSLSYAKRKTRESGLSTIEYAQADLLRLGSLGRSFDVVESVGVLHHLADPLAGWRVLLSLLRPGGFMYLGFYSETARRNIVKARSFIASQGYSATADDIRRFRQDLMSCDNSEDFATTLSSRDFFSISTCRDLLFHVQEKLMTLTVIDEFIRENGLLFLGFEIDSHLLASYRQRFPDDRAATDLGQWQIFENENPGTFANMYQFWVQKSG